MTGAFEIGAEEICGSGSGAAAYAGTVAGLTFASAFSAAAGSYTAPGGGPTYNGAVAGLSFALALSIAAGTYADPLPYRPSAPPVGRHLSTAVRGGNKNRRTR